MDKNVAIGLLTCGIALIGIPTVGWVTVFAAGKMESLKQQYPLVIIIAWLMAIGGAVLGIIGGAGLTQVSQSGKGEEIPKICWMPVITTFGE